MPTIEEEVEEFVQWIFSHHDMRTHVRDAKAIQDAVWGTHRFDKAEVDLIDTPLIQRLRQVHQTANSFWTYPSLHHTRFEHTLGTIIQVTRLCNSLLEKLRAKGQKEELISKWTSDLRVAAILHDCGHGPFSHSSEEVYQNHPEIERLKKTDQVLSSARPHEVLSNLIIKSDSFQDYFKTIMGDSSPIYDLELIRSAIAGHPMSADMQYVTDAINGPFDADKLDYLLRDGHFSGLPLNVDLERLWLEINIGRVKEKNAEGGNAERRRLTIDWGGIQCLEQIVFMKMIMYPTLYHHHKVRAADCMFKAIIEYIQDPENDITLERNGKKIDFSSPVHFLYFTDYDFFDNSLCAIDEKLHELIHNLQYRRLLKRAMIISRETTTDETRSRIDELTKYIQKPTNKAGNNEFREVAGIIRQRAGTTCLPQQIWVDCPRHPDFKEAYDSWVTPLGAGDPVNITQYFQIDQYANQYKQNKWRGHVFCKPEDINAVARAAKDVFRERYGIEVEDTAFQICNVEPPK